MPELVAGCDVVLGNEEDAAMVLGIHPEGVDVTSGHVEAEAYESVSKQVMARFPRCKKVITTLRVGKCKPHSWSGVLWMVQTYEAPISDHHIVDRLVGAIRRVANL